MDKERALIKQTLFEFLDNILRIFTVSVSIGDVEYNLALTILKFFDIEVLPYKYDIYIGQVIPHTGSIFTFGYSSIDNRISLKISGYMARMYTEKYSSRDLDELKEEISVYVDNSSNSDIVQLYRCVITPIIM